MIQPVPGDASAGSGPEWPAPGKLNLFLHVTGRRDDGFHDLQTVFQFLDVGDALRFSPRDDDAIVRHGGLADVAPEHDLVVRAARCLRADSGLNAGVDIHLEKRLPSQAGLGGGSSDAATTLVALNHIWGLDRSPEELAVLGAGLGADVPVFVHGQAAWAEGRGDRLRPVTLPEPCYLVIRPDCAIATGELFAAPDLRRDSPAISVEDFLAGAGRNDFEPVAAALYPPVREALDWLGRFAPARLTGTGSCVFAAFDEEAVAREALSRLPSQWQGFVARGRNRSPLIDRLLGR